MRAAHGARVDEAADPGPRMTAAHEGLRVRAYSALWNRIRFLESSPSDPATGPGVSEPPLLKPGDVCGPYRVVRELGKGGMGQVFLAEDTRLDTYVALKCLADPWLNAADARERLMREAKAVARLSGHPHIADLRHIVEVEHEQRPRLLMVMERAIRYNSMASFDTRRERDTAARSR
jgi:serine/threonine protein kinase